MVIEDKELWRTDGILRDDLKEERRREMATEENGCGEEMAF